LRLYRRACPDGNPRHLTSEAPGTPYGLAEQLLEAHSFVGVVVESMPSRESDSA